MRDWFRPQARRYLALALLTGPLLLPATVSFLLARAFVMQKRKPELTDPATAGRALQLAEVALPRALFAAILRRIDCPRGPPVAVT